MTSVLNFWKIDGSKRDERSEWDEEMDFEQVLCPVNRDHMRAGRRNTNLHVVLRDGMVEDFIQTQYSEWLIQDHVLQTLRAENITGFDVKPVVARFATSKARPPVLWELVVTGWGGMASPESGVHLLSEESCASCGFLTYSGISNPKVLIDAEKWDKSSLFRIWPLPMFVFADEKFARLALSIGFTGFDLTHFSEVKGAEGFSPGRLHYYMPEGRAHELGDALGIY